MMNGATRRRWILTAAVCAAGLTGCSKSADRNPAAGTAIAAAGPAIQVTRADRQSVSRAAQYAITPDNFSRFLAAADSVAALEARDSSVRRYLHENFAAANPRDADAGLKRLESNPAVSQAINRAGLSVEDYFVQGIAIAAAEQFVNAPKGASAPPPLVSNAAFLRVRMPELARLHAQREGRPVVASRP